VKTKPPDGTRVEITAEVDRHTAEALRLEVHRLARRHGLQIEDVVEGTSADRRV
jgi:hypothetical protein